MSLDVIEHVADQARYLAEIDRIAADGATIALATPNRFSLAAEPHVQVWGVGWVPTRFQARYVRARSGRAYDFVRLLSVPASRCSCRATRASPVASWCRRYPTTRSRRCTRRRARLARLYNRLAGSPLLRWPLLGVGPFFRYTGAARTPANGCDGDTRTT